MCGKVAEEKLYRAFVWFENLDIDVEDFVSVHSRESEEDLQQKVDDEMAWLNSVGFPFIKVEMEVIGGVA